jgi:aminoglycoside phosphotransferase (APT) family kinase protein
VSDRNAELAAGLERVLADRTGTAWTVRDLTRLSGGASRETWAFTAVAPDGAERPLVLQRERAGGNGAGGGMTNEGKLLRAAAAAGVPVAPVVATDEGGDELGAPFIVMDRVEGETIARRILRDDRYAEARTGLAREAGAALAAVHRIDPEAVPGLPEDDPVEQFRDLIDALGEPHPAFELGLRWLERHRPATRRRGVVHGDFRMGNLIVGEDGLRAVLDWELSHLGDPVEDLGWFCVRAWRFGSPLRAGGVGTVEDLVEGYVAAGGAPVAEEDLRWWEAMGTLKWGVICIVQAMTHLSGATRSVELAAIGRRTAENEEDLLELIAGPSTYEPVLASRPSKEVTSPPHDRPTAAELLDAVGEYLVEVRDGVEGRLGFHARVAGNVVATVRRELELGPARREAHAARLAALGVADDAELAAAIRSGTVDDRLDEVTAAVRGSVRDKLAVANPGYWERP